MNECEHCKMCLYRKLYEDALHLVQRVSKYFFDRQTLMPFQQFNEEQNIRERADYIYSQHEVKDVSANP